MGVTFSSQATVASSRLPSFAVALPALCGCRPHPHAIDPLRSCACGLTSPPKKNILAIRGKGRRKLLAISLSDTLTPSLLGLPTCHAHFPVYAGTANSQRLLVSTTRVVRTVARPKMRLPSRISKTKSTTLTAYKWLLGGGAGVCSRRREGRRL